QTSAQQYPTHTYASAGTFNWSMTATVQGVICSRTGSIVISAACVLACAATVPSTGTAGVAINYAATATPSNCTGSPAFAWDFGDGQSSTQQSPSHAYTSAGTYTWSMTVTVQGVPCIKTGSIVVSAGDVNGDGEINVQDVFYLINALFAGGPAPIGSGDVNGDTQVNVSDVFYLINYLFAGGPAPV
ncbi:MAG TPA: PKD domain-containing protein, partial [Thermoanaerobaculaceae bacterium]|nr:PKD domain-containing protein [Thermoanaerobaculaceae bacterium]